MAGLNRPSILVLLLLAAGQPARADLFDDLGLQRPDRNLGRRPRDSGDRPAPPARRDPVNEGPSKSDLRRAEREKQERAKKLAQAWLPLGQNQPAVYAPTSTVTTVPDSRYFGEPPAASDTFLAPLAKVGMAGTRIPSGNLRRAAAIVAHLRNASGPVSDEDAAFLASQAALAMEGAPLQVIVEDNGASGSMGRELGNAVQTLGREQGEFETARADRPTALGEYRGVVDQTESGAIDATTAAARKNAAEVRYAEGARRERDAKKAVREATSGVVRIFVGGREVRP